MNDQELLAHAIAELKRTGRMEYTGEFGAEITTFIPFVAWLQREGLLKGRRIVSHAGMEPFYFFLEEGQFGAKQEPRRWLPPPERAWPSNSTYTATRQPWHVIPDYRARYRDQGRRFDKPVLFIQNKFTVEYEVGPFNYISLRALERLLQWAPQRFSVVYSRPRYKASVGGYSVDHNAACEYPDLELVRQVEGVEILEDICETSGAGYNETKLEILAKAHMFVGVQGGGAHVLACFGRSLLLLLHLIGEEYPHAYQAGPYKYLSDPPPVLLVARNHADFGRGLEVLRATLSIGDQIKMAAHAKPHFEALRM